MRNALSFFTESIQVLFDIANEIANTLNNASSLDESLEKFNFDDIALNFSMENVGINTDAAVNDFNMSVEDINEAMQEAKGNLTNDHLLSGIDDLTKEAKTFLKNQTEDASNIKLINHWLMVMENGTSEYFTNESCISFLDCTHFAVYQLYGLFDAENVTNMSNSLKLISRFEDLFLKLTGNVSQTVIEVYYLTQTMTTTLKEINDYDVFCSEPPTMLSQIANQNVTEGSILRLYCNVTGNPPPQIWWYRQDEYLLEQTGRILEINNISKTDGKKYRCIAGNLVENLSLDFADIFVSEDTPEIVTSTPQLNSLISTDATFGDSTNIIIILGTTLPAVGLITAIGVIFAWRLRVRNKNKNIRQSRKLHQFEHGATGCPPPHDNAKDISLETPLE